MSDASAALHVEIWSDVACPWCYIGQRRFAAALADFEHRDDVVVTWRSYQLSPEADHSSAHPDMTEVDLLVRMKGMRVEDVRAMLAHVTALAAGEGLAYDFDRVVPANTFDAHRLIHLARRSGGPDLAASVVERLMSAHFEHGLAVDDLQVLVALASDSGLDPSAVREALSSDHAADEVAADIETGRALGVTGVPFFVLDRRLAVSGAQSVELFSQALAQAWDGRRAAA